MIQTPTEPQTPQRPLLIWPGVLFAVVQVLTWFGLPAVRPEATAVAGLGGVVAGLAIVVWWAFFSRAPRSERWGAVVLMIVGLFAARPFLHKSIATGGMGILYFFYAIPVLTLAFVGAVVLSRQFTAPARRTTLFATILLACGGWTLVRTHGTFGGGTEFGWRWAPTPEDRLLAHADDLPAAVPTTAIATTPAGGSSAADTAADWPGFRGRERDGVVTGVPIATDWSRSPPAERWRRLLGPGWSSFAVHGQLLYTQEQRGEDELVSCYDVTTGDPVWRHSDPVRFWNSEGGPGPRATPSLSHGRVYAFGGTGILNALDATDGTVVWSRNVPADTEAKVPHWGFSSSPLIVDDLVVVYARKLAAYDASTGEPRWFGPAYGVTYSSPHLATIDGVAQVLLLGGPGAISLAAADGALLWEHTWEGASIVQPSRTADGDLLLSALGMNGGVGLRRIGVGREGGNWTLQERWTSTGLKPYFSDFVVNDGHAFGFDGRILSCIDLADGRRKWKGGRYGNGQLLLLADQDALLVVAENGDLALVAAKPDQFTELARVPALEGKTWNHPALVGDSLLLRNGQEMAAFQLPLAGS